MPSTVYASPYLFCHYGDDKAAAGSDCTYHPIAALYCTETVEDSANIRSAENDERGKRVHDGNTFHCLAKGTAMVPGDLSPEDFEGTAVSGGGSSVTDTDLLHRSEDQLQLVAINKSVENSQHCSIPLKPCHAEDGLEGDVRLCYKRLNSSPNISLTETLNATTESSTLIRIMPCQSSYTVKNKDCSLIAQCSSPVKNKNRSLITKCSRKFCAQNNCAGICAQTFTGSEPSNSSSSASDTDSVEKSEFEKQRAQQFHCEQHSMWPCFVACASTDGTVSVLCSKTGVVLGSIRLPGEVFSSPVIVGDHLIVGCRDDFVYCYNITISH